MQNYSRPRREEFKAYVKNVPIDMTKVRCPHIFVEKMSARLEKKKNHRLFDQSLIDTKCSQLPCF